MIAEVLGRGQESAKPSRDICSWLGIELRDLTVAIMNERRAGVPICSTTSGDTRGYFLAANKEEMLRFCGSLNRRAREIDKTREACMKTIDDLPDR
jgi:hypothetical protein